MDTSSTVEKGRLSGFSASSVSLGGSTVNEMDLQRALSELDNLGQVKVSSVDHGDAVEFAVTFVSVYGEMPLISSSDTQIDIRRNLNMIGVTEIQTITTSADKAFIYEVQSVSILDSHHSFKLSLNNDYTAIIAVQEQGPHPQVVEAELNKLEGVTVMVDPMVQGSGVEGDPWTILVTFIEPVGNVPLLESDKAEITEDIRGFSPLAGTLVLGFAGEFTPDLQFDCSPMFVKQEALEYLPSIEEVNVQKIDINTGYRWDISFTKDIGNLPSIQAYNNRFEVQRISSKGGFPTPLGGRFISSYGEEATMPLPFDIADDVLKSALEDLTSIDRVDVSKIVYDNGQCNWLITFRVPESPMLFECLHLS